MHHSVPKFVGNCIACEPITEKSSMPDMAWYSNYDRFSVVASKARVTLHFPIGDDLESERLEPFDRPEIRLAQLRTYTYSRSEIRKGARSLEARLRTSELLGGGTLKSSLDIRLALFRFHLPRSYFYP